jgi:hypothetical protein
VTTSISVGTQREVMDVAMSLLGGGLQAQVLMQGKKVPDEGATLLQMGISSTAKPESLDLMLEPSQDPAPHQQFQRTHCWFSPMLPTNITAPGISITLVAISTVCYVSLKKHMTISSISRWVNNRLCTHHLAFP